MLIFSFFWRFPCLREMFAFHALVLCFSSTSPGSYWHLFEILVSIRALNNEGLPWSISPTSASNYRGGFLETRLVSVLWFCLNHSPIIFELILAFEIIKMVLGTDLTEIMLMKKFDTGSLLRNLMWLFIFRESRFSESTFLSIR